MPLTDVIKSMPASPRALLGNIWFRFPRTVSEIPVVFILGTPRSGTTLLKSILCANSAASGVDGETTEIFQYRDVFAHPYPGRSEADRKAILRQSKDLIDFYARWIRPIMEARGSRVFVDKLYRVDHFLIGMIRKGLPNTRFLYISRDGRDCYCSALHHPYVHQRSSLARFAKYYNRNEMERVRIFGDDPVLLHVQYEKLVAEPETVVRAICLHAGLEYEPGMICPKLYSRTHLAESEIHKNLKHTIHKGRVGRFLRDMRACDIATFEKHARRALEMLGYTLVSGTAPKG